MQRGLSIVNFPYLSSNNYSVESPESDNYNCIAWACGLDDRTFWPDNEYHEWPPDLPQDDAMVSFVAFFERAGYQICDSPDCEEDFEKIAIFAKDNEPTHATRQLVSGKWASKMGYEGVDIEHDALENIEGPGYGRATIFLRKVRGES